MASRARRTVSRTQAAAAIDAVIDRRRRCDDPDLAHLPDDPIGLAGYVSRCQRVPADVLAADVLDALLALEYARAAVPAVPAELDALEYLLLRSGRAAGLTFAALAVPLGLRSKQAAEHRLLRYASASRGGPAHERAERAARRAEARERGWLQRHGPDLLAATGALLAARDSLDGELAEDLNHLADSLAAVPAATAADYLVRMGRVAARVRLLLADVERPPPGLADLLGRLAKLTEGHYRASSPDR